LIRQLREARKEVARLKAESLTERIKMKDLMDMYSNTLDLEKNSARRALPLHKQLNNIYWKTKAFSLKIESSRKNCIISRKNCIISRMNWPRGT
jgi:hypothetical protein